MKKIKGTIIIGKGRGKGIGYPTANIDSSPAVVDGVYVGYTVIASISNKSLPSLIFVGVAHTFNATKKSCEVYILDFDQDIYGREVQVVFHEKIRDNMKFANVSDLVLQIDADVKTARIYFYKRT